MDEHKLSAGLAVSENGFLFNSGTGETFTSNPIAVRILNELKLGTTQENLEKLLVEEYDVDQERLKRDIDDFVFQLKQFGLLENQ